MQALQLVMRHIFVVTCKHIIQSSLKIMNLIQFVKLFPDALYAKRQKTLFERTKQLQLGIDGEKNALARLHAWRNSTYKIVSLLRLNTNFSTQRIHCRIWLMGLLAKSRITHSNYLGNNKIELNRLLWSQSECIKPFIYMRCWTFRRLACSNPSKSNKDNVM